MHLTDRLKRLVPHALKERVKPLLLEWVLPRELKDAKRYVGTDEVSGRLQLELLKREGCTPHSTVLEIGCGNLHAGMGLIQYLEERLYVGVDPNEWLRRPALKDPHASELVRRKRARFLSVDDFDAGKLGIRFDFVLSHSVLSHCAHWQLEQFLRNAGKVLAPGARILASLRLAEGNAYGSPGTPGKQDSMNESWQYPGVSWFKLATVTKTADQCGLTAVLKSEYGEFFVKSCP